MTLLGHQIGGGKSYLISSGQPAFDPSTLSNMTGIFSTRVGAYQDTARTVPVTADGQDFQGWENQVTTPPYHIQKASGSNAAIYVENALNGLPALRLDWSEPQWMTGSAGTVLSSVFNADGKAAYMLIRKTGTFTSDPLPFNNDPIFNDSSLFWAAVLRQIGGSPSFTHYNWDGNADVANVTPPLVSGTPYVLYLGHDGVNLHASVNGGTVVTAPSGNTTDMTNSMMFFQPAGFNGTFEVFELWTADAVHADADRDAAIAGLMALKGS